MQDTRSLILLEVNELNFDVVETYIRAGAVELPNFEKLIGWKRNLTQAEESYCLLEPWIQWPSVHTGLAYNDHKLFRLGDAALAPPEQIFEKIEAAGYSVGAISPMNAINALASPSYFIPDPWTETASDASFFSRGVTKALRQTVNDNSAGNISVASLLFIIYGILSRVRYKTFLKLLWLAIRSKGRPWRKAIFLDVLLNEWHLSLFKEKSPNFSTVFFNAGAHIQHHYFLNAIPPFGVPGGNPDWYVESEADPLLELLQAYDDILGDYLSMCNSEILVATGLSQRPVAKSVLYYRLQDHEAFLQQLHIPFERVQPRMTRDFLITFASEEDAKSAENTLSATVTLDGTPIFGEIDNRGRDLFVVLTYPHEITDETIVSGPGFKISLAPFVVFVAVKNGEHIGKGFAFYSDGLETPVNEQNMHVSRIFHTIHEFFGLERLA